jgi:hypothetical protein
MSGEPALRILFVAEGAALARFGKMTLCIMRTAPSLRVVKMLRSETMKLRAEAPDGWLAFSVVEATAISNIPEEVRAATAELMRDYAATVSVTVIEGSTFKSIAARAIMSGLHTLSRSRNLQKYFADARVAVDWMLANAARLGAPQDDVTAEAVHLAIAETRAKL